MEEFPPVLGLTKYKTDHIMCQKYCARKRFWELYKICLRQLVPLERCLANIAFCLLVYEKSAMQQTIKVFFVSQFLWVWT